MSGGSVHEVERPSVEPFVPARTKEKGGEDTVLKLGISEHPKNAPPEKKY